MAFLVIGALAVIILVIVTVVGCKCMSECYCLLGLPQILVK